MCVTDSLSCTPENNSIETITKSYITFGPIIAQFLKLCNDFQII